MKKIKIILSIARAVLACMLVKIAAKQINESMRREYAIKSKEVT